MADPEKSPESENQPPEEMFSTVWVKVEVEDDGYMDGINQGSEETQDNNDSMDTGDNQEKCQESRKTVSVDIKIEEVKIEEVQMQEVETDYIEKQPENESKDFTKVKDQKSKATTIEASEEKPKKKRVYKIPTVELRCDYCDYKTLYKNCLKFHIMNHTNPNPFTCDRCNYTTKYSNYFQKHILQHQIKENAVPPNTPLYQCPQCPYTSLFKMNFVAHKRKHKVEKKYKCEKCDFATNYASYYNRHIKAHESEGETYSCTRCSFVSKHKGHISRHMAIIHKEVPEQAFRCEHCEFTTLYRLRMTIHRKNHKLPHPIKCEFCDFCAQTTCAHKLHKAKHIANGTIENDRKFPPRLRGKFTSFEACPMQTNQKDSSVPLPPKDTDKLFTVAEDSIEIDWQSIEVGFNPGEEKPYHCVECEFQSKVKGSVQRHFQRQHTSDEMKPYKCNSCDFATKTKTQITKHTKKSISPMLLHCTQCGYSTYFKCQYVKHHKSHKTK